MEPIDDRGSSAAETMRAPAYISIEDQKELALVAFRMEERRASPEQVREAVARTRLGQIDRDQQALAVVDASALQQQGRADDESAQAALDHYIRNVDSIYSGLAPVDRTRAGYLAHLANAQAKAITCESLLVQARAAGLSLEEATIERQLAAAGGAPPAALAAYDARIAGARLLLDGEAGGLLAWLDAARAAYDAAAQQLTRLEAELELALADYRAGVDTSVPWAVAKVGELRASLGLAASRPDLEEALRDLAAVLPTATPDALGAALARIEARPEGDGVFHTLEGAGGILAADPRLRVLSGRQSGGSRALERLAQLFGGNSALVGIPSLLDILLGCTGEEATELMAMVRRSVTLEGTAMRTVPGVLQPGVQRPHEVLDFLRGGGDEALAAFRGLRRAGWSADDARTIATLARNGRAAGDVEAALAAGQSLDELVAETLFRTVGAAEAHQLSGIPRSFPNGKSIEDVAALARRRGVDLLVRHARRGAIDLLAVVERDGAGYGFVRPNTPRDLAVRGDLAGIAAVPGALPADDVPGLVVHGDAVSYFETARTWGPAVAFTSDGRIVWLGTVDAVEYWLKLRDVSAEPYARYSGAASWLAGRDVPLSSAAYLAGTAVGDLAEVLWALPAAAATPALLDPQAPTPVLASTPAPVATDVSAPTPTR